jgi:hypothetical protein
MLLSGISLIWLGFYLNSLPTASTTATYAIDGQSPITFNLNGASSEATGLQYNQIFFQVDELSSGSHTLDVVYQGNSTTTPLTLYILQVQNNASSHTAASSSTGTLSQSPIASSSSSGAVFSTLIPTRSSSVTSSAIGGISTNGSSNASSDTTNGASNLGSIIGGVIGGLGLLIFAVLAVLFLRQRNSRSQKTDTIVKPFLGPSTTLPPPLTQHSSPDNLFSNPQYTSDNANTASSLSPLTPSLTPNHLIQVNNSTPFLASGIREQRKGGEFSSRTPQLQQETQLEVANLSSSSYNSQPIGLVRDEDAGNNQLSRTDQHGNFVELLPPVYSF